MAQKLKLVLRRPILKLAFRGLLLAGAAYLFRYSGDFLYFALLTALSSYFYLRPAINNDKFSFVAGSIFVLFLITPEGSSFLADFLAISAFAAAFTLIVGIKNVVFIKRLRLYTALHLALITAMPFIFFAYPESVISVSVFFIAIYLVLRNYYSAMLQFTEERANASAAISALVSVQFAWVVSIMPISQAARALLAALCVVLVSNVVASFFDRKNLLGIAFKRVSNSF